MQSWFNDLVYFKVLSFNDWEASGCKKPKVYGKQHVLTEQRKKGSQTTGLFE